MIAQVTISALAFISVLVAVRGDTWDKTKAGARKLTMVGRVALLCGFATALVAVFQAKSAEKSRQGELEKASAQIKELHGRLELLTTPAYGHIENGHTALFDERFEDALKHYELALAKDARSVEAWIGKAYGHLSIHHGGLRFVGPMWGIKDFVGESPSEQQWLARLAAMKALEYAQDDLSRIRANVLIGLADLSGGDFGNYWRGIPGRWYRAPLTRAPAWYFMDAIELNKQQKISGWGIALTQHNTRMFYAGIAREGLVAIADVGDNKKWLAEHLEKYESIWPD